MSFLAALSGAARPAGMTPRLLLAIRLSQMTDNTTSPDTQRQMTAEYAERQRATVVHAVEDLDVSATKYPPMSRPGIGPWFRELTPECTRNTCGHRPDTPCMGQWDDLIVPKMDRFVRSLLDFCVMVQWANTHGKNVVAVAENLVINSPMAQILAPILALLAQIEASNTAYRVRNSREWLRRNGFFGGGLPPYGMMAVAADHAEHRILIPSLETGPILREMHDRYNDGQSFHAIAKWLNEAEIPTSRMHHGHKLSTTATYRPAGEGRAYWSAGAVKRILTSAATAGLVCKKGSLDPDYDEEGRVMRFAEDTVLSWEEIQENRRKAASKKVSTPKVNRPVHPLTGIVYCEGCQQTTPWNLPSSTKGALPYYRCKSRAGRKACPEHGAAEADLMAFLDEAFLGFRLNPDPLDFNSPDLAGLVAADIELGDMEITQEIRKAGANNNAAIAEMESRLDAMFAQFGDTKSDSLRAALERNLTKLSKKLDALKAQPIVPDHVTYKGTGQTYREFWADADTETRRAFLMDCGVRIYIGPALSRGTRTQKAIPNLRIEVPADLIARARDNALRLASA